jgi:hypothetical protein
VIELAIAWSDALYSQDAAIELDDAIMRLRAAQGTMT